MKQEIREILNIFKWHPDYDFFYVVMVDMAHTLNLLTASHLKQQEAQRTLKALQEIKHEDYSTLGNYEDIHEAVEAKLIDKTEEGRKIQTAKSSKEHVDVVMPGYNLMVKKAEIPFRSAHRVVGQLALEGKYSPSLEDVDDKEVRRVMEWE